MVAGVVSVTALATAFVAVRPDTKGFRAETETKIKADMAKIGVAAGNTFAKAFTEQVSKRSGDIPVGPSKQRTRKQGEESGGAFADGFKRRLTAAARSLPPLTIGVAKTAAEQAIRDVQEALRDLGSKRIGVDLDARAAAEQARALQRQLADLAATSPDIQVRADTARAAAELAKIHAEVDALDRDDVNIRVDVDDNATRSLSGIFDGANNGRAGILALVGAAALIGPAIIPVAAAATVALAGLSASLGALVVGAGVGALAFSGVGDAVKALGAAQRDATKNSASLAGAQNALAGAADGVRSALASQAQTQSSVSEANRRAAQSVTDAQRALTSAEADALRVRRDLTAAQEDARRNLEDLASAVKNNALDQRQAVLDEAEARARLAKATGAERVQAQLDYDRAVQRLNDLRTQGTRLQSEQRESNRKGIAGSDQVLAARERIAEADRRVADAQRKLAEERRQQTITQQRGAFQLAEAARSVAAAQRQLGQASTAAGVAGSASMAKLKESMAALSPAGQRFARFLFGVKDQFRQLRDAAQAGFLPGVERAITILLPYLPTLARFVGQVATKMGDLAVRTMDAFTSPQWRELGRLIGGEIVPSLDRMWRIGMNVARGFAGIVAAFLPLNATVGDGLVGLSERFADWGTALRGSSGFGAFMDYVRDNLPAVLRFFRDLGALTVHVVKALAKLGPSALAGFSLLVAGITAIPPEVLAGIVAGIGAIATVMAAVNVVSRVAAVGMALFNAATIVVGAVVGAIGAPVAIAIAALIALGIGLVVLYRKSETFRSIVQGAWAGIQTAIKWAWERVIQPALAAMQWYLSNVLGPVMRWLYQNVVKPAWQAIQIAISVAWAAIRVIFGLMQIGIKILGAVFSSLYQTFVKPTWDRIRPVFAAVGSYLGQHVVPAIKSGVTAIGKAWQGIQEAAKVPVRFVVNTVLNNGILAGYNKLAKLFHVKPDDVRINLPKGFATGGRVTGPGGPRDDLIPAMLSNGEYVIPARTVAQHGVGFFDELTGNRSSGGQRAAAGYKDGGLVDVAGAIAKDLFGAVTNPGKVIGKPINALIDRIPGAGAARNIATGVARKGLDGLTGWIEALTSPMTGAGTGIGSAAGRLAEIFGGSVSPSGMQPAILAALASLRATFGNVPLLSGLRPGSRTLTGNVSYHASGRAFDIPPVRSWAVFLRDTFGRWLKELITPWQALNLNNGRPHVYTGAVWRQHNFAGGNAHIHAAMRDGGLVARSYDAGGYLPEGWSLAHNGTGRPEPVGHGLGGETHFHFHGPVSSREGAKAMVLDAVTQLRRERKL